MFGRRRRGRLSISWEEIARQAVNDVAALNQAAAGHPTPWRIVDADGETVVLPHRLRRLAVGSDYWGDEAIDTTATERP